MMCEKYWRSITSQNSFDQQTLLRLTNPHVSVNRHCKHFMIEKFQGWYAGEVEKKINAGQNTSDIAIEMGIPVPYA